MKRIKLLFISLSLAVLCSTTSFGITAAEVVEMMDAKKSPSTTHGAVKIEIIEKDGTISERQTESFMATDSKGTNYSMIIFRSPASVKNTRFLTIEQADGKEDKQIYLPALKKVRRIGASEGGSSFMGTEFTYDDISSSSGSLEKDTYKLLGEEEIAGYDCYIIESIPKDKKSSPYARKVLSIIKDEKILLPIKVEFYDKDGKLLKVLTSSSLKDINGYWTPMVLEMKNVQTKRGTRIITVQIELDKKMNSKIFSTRFLQTGKLK